MSFSLLLQNITFETPRKIFHEEVPYFRTWFSCVTNRQVHAEIMKFVSNYSMGQESLPKENFVPTANGFLKTCRGTWNWWQFCRMCFTSSRIHKATLPIRESISQSLVKSKPPSQCNEFYSNTSSLGIGDTFKRFFLSC